MNSGICRYYLERLASCISINLYLEHITSILAQFEQGFIALQLFAVKDWLLLNCQPANRQPLHLPTMYFLFLCYILGHVSFFVKYCDEVDMTFPHN